MERVKKTNDELTIAVRKETKYPVQAKSATSTREKIQQAVVDREKKDIGFFDKLFGITAGREKSERLKNSKRYGIETKMFPWDRYVPEYRDSSKLIEKGATDPDASVWSTHMSGSLLPVIFTGGLDNSKPAVDTNVKPGLSNLMNLVSRYRQLVGNLKTIAKDVDSLQKKNKMPAMRTTGEALGLRDSEEKGGAVPAYVYRYDGEPRKKLIQYHKIFNHLYGPLDYMKRPEALRPVPKEHIYDKDSESLQPLAKYIYDLDYSFLESFQNLSNRSKIMKNLAEEAQTRVEMYRAHLLFTIAVEHSDRIRELYIEHGSVIQTAYKVYLDTVKRETAEQDMILKNVIAKAQHEHDDNDHELTQRAVEVRNATETKVKEKMAENETPADIDKVLKLCHTTKATDRDDIYRSVIP